MKKINFMKEMEGQEVWTDALGDRFGERVCVGVEKGMLWSGGRKFRPTKKEVKGVWDDMIYNEFGSPAQRKKDLEWEFGGEAKKLANKINKKRLMK